MAARFQPRGHDEHSAPTLRSRLRQLGVLVFLLGAVCVPVLAGTVFRAAPASISEIALPVAMLIAIAVAALVVIDLIRERTTPRD